MTDDEIANEEERHPKSGCTVTMHPLGCVILLTMLLLLSALLHHAFRSHGGDGAAGRSALQTLFDRSVQRPWSIAVESIGKGIGHRVLSAGNRVVDTRRGGTLA